jgi:hypothetical protein
MNTHNTLHIGFSIFLCCLLYIKPSHAQFSLDEINKKRNQHNWNGMVIFSTWTAANLISSTVGLLVTEGETKHFFEMNLYFNLINMAIAVPGIISARKNLKRKSSFSFEKTVKEVQKVKTTFLVNAVLDVSYITAGFLLREMAKNPIHTQNKNRFKGFGNALILQGAWLFIFDFIEYGLHTSNGKKLAPHWQQWSMSTKGLGLKINYQLATVLPANYSHLF